MINIDSKNPDELLNILYSKNVQEIERNIEFLIFQSDEELNKFVKNFIKFLLNSQQMEEKCSRIAVKIKAKKFKEVLFNEVQNILLERYENGKIEDDKADELLRLVSFIGHLYNLDFVENDFINLVLDVLFENEKTCDRAADCITNLLTVAGLKLKMNKNDKTNRYFDFLKYVVEIENKKTHRSIVYAELLKLHLEKKEKFMGPEETSPEISNNDETDEMKKLPIDPEKYVVEFINSMWTSISSDRENIKTCAKLCKETSLKTFFKSRHFFIDSLILFIQNQPYDDQNVNQIMFIAELFKHELISDDILELWIKPKSIKKLSLEIVIEIINAVSSKPNVSQDVKVTALLMTLEDIASDETAEIYTAIKKDIKELLEIFSGRE